MKLPKILLRLAILAAVTGGGYYLYQHLSPSQRQDIRQQASKQTQKAASKVKGMADTFNIDTQSLLDQAGKKLLEKQPIIDDMSSTQDSPDNSNQQSTDPQIKGVSDTQDYVNQASQKIVDEVKSLPKKQAAKITRQVCEQIITQLEEEE